MACKNSSIVYLMLSFCDNIVDMKRLVQSGTYFKEKYIQMKTYRYLCMVRKGKAAAKRYFIPEISFNKDCAPNKSL